MRMKGMSLQKMRRRLTARLSGKKGGPTEETPDNRPVGDMRAFLEDIAARGFCPRHIMDVGANYGEWSILARSLFPAARFTLIEPQIEMKPSLDRFCAATSGARWINVGAGPENKEMLLTVWPDMAGSSLIPTPEEAWSYGKKQRKVRVQTIDSILEEHGLPVPDLVKMDIQGYEIEALKGASGVLGKTELIILEVSLFRFSEHQPLAHEVIEFMAKHGYHIYDFCGFLRRPYDGALGQTDMVFVQEQSRLRASRQWLTDS